MAKLSVRGRIEVFRVSKERKYSESERKEKNINIVWARWTKAYMSDGVILEKYDVKHEPSEFGNKGRFHSYGWKKKGKVTGELPINEMKERYLKAGWKADV